MVSLKFEYFSFRIVRYLTNERLVLLLLQKSEILKVSECDAEPMY